jgi:hypothetical protein
VLRHAFYAVEQRRDPASTSGGGGGVPWVWRAMAIAVWNNDDGKQAAGRVTRRSASTKRSPQ